MSKFITPDDLDSECLRLCQAMNALPGIQTVESCCGHGGNEPFRIWFFAESLEVLPKLLYWFDGCHSGHYKWTIQVTTDCAMSPVTFMVVGPPGAYAEADEIASCLAGGDGDV